MKYNNRKVMKPLKEYNTLSNEIQLKDPPKDLFFEK